MHQVAQWTTDLASYLAASGISLYSYDLIDSTNTQAKRIAATAKLPALLVANGQTAGRGRMGRSFFSPLHTGLYCSLLVEQEGDVTGLTAAAAVAAVRAIRQVTGQNISIKWVNDIYFGTRKLAGILAEGFTVGEKRFAVIGMGINLSTEAFPADLQDKAISLGLHTDCRASLAAAFAKELTQLLSALPSRDWMAEYRQASLVLGRKITYIQNGASHSGIAREIADDGALIVRHQDGTQHRLCGGEISVSLTTEQHANDTNDTNERNA